MGSLIRTSAAASCAGLVLACSEAGSPALIRFEPARALNDRETPVVLVGRALAPVFEEDGADVRAVQWQATVGGIALREVAWKSRERIEAVVPPGVPIGTHDVELVTGPLRVRLAGAFVSIAPSAPRIDRATPGRLPPNGAEVVLEGNGFHVPSKVRLRGAEVPVSWIDDQTLRIVAPPGEPGPARLEIATPVGRVWDDELLRYEAAP